MYWIHEIHTFQDAMHTLHGKIKGIDAIGKLTIAQLESCKQALAMRQAMYGSGVHHYVAYSLNSTGVALTGLGKLEEGLKHSEQALAMLKEVYKGQDHPCMVLFLDNIVISLSRLGRVAEEEAYRTEASAMRERLLAHKAP